jgi:ribonuclease D
MDTHYELVTEREPFVALVERMLGEACVAIDTEFVWERTFYAQLGLVQVGLASGEVYLLDPLALGDMSPLGRVLESRDVIKILHDAPQDLMILKRATGSTTHRVFDTRLAAGFAGLSSVISLQGLLLELLGFELQKGAQRTDWTRRPLSKEQLDYAADDVIYLPGVMATLRQRASDRGAEAWLDDDLTALDASDLYEERPPEDAYRRVKGAGRMKRRELAVLREVSACRERIAQRLDRPRRRVLEDRDLMTLARVRPQSESEMMRCDLHPGQIRSFGGELLESIRTGMELTDEACPPPISRPDARRIGKERIDAVWTRLRAILEEAQIDPDLSASKAEVTGLLADGAAADPAKHRLLRGWRKGVFGEYLGSVLNPPQLDLL